MKLQMTLLSFASSNTLHSFSTIVKPVSVLRLIKVSSKHKFSLDLHTSRASTFIHTFHFTCIPLMKVSRHDDSKFYIAFFYQEFYVLLVTILVIVL